MTGQSVWVLRRLAVAAAAASVLVTAVPVAAMAQEPVASPRIAVIDDEPALASDAPTGDNVLGAIQASLAQPGSLLADLVEDANLPDDRARELAYAVGVAPAAKDQRGIMPSLYRGKWYMPKREKVRKCIVRRESHGHYRAVSAGGDYRGAYQMSRSLALGATYLMQREVAKEMGPQGVKIVKALRKKPTQTWNRYWQDRAFWTIWQKGDGRGHWGGCH